jgi:hypothetical protein
MADDDKPIPLRPPLKVIEGGQDQPLDPERLVEQLRTAGAMLTAQFELLRARAERAEQHAELAQLGERIARQELDRLRAQLDGRQWSLWRRLRWALGLGR